ncbi:MAG: hypothetical protein GY696_31305 [Gammaproteobacteria bacterium]|nr:hypothetical protein [Gammaproteobacteria bacterium]
MDDPAWVRPDHSQTDVVCPESKYAYQEKSRYKALCPSIKWMLFANRGTDREVDAETLAEDQRETGVSITRADSVLFLRMGYHPSVTPQFFWVDTELSFEAACSVFGEVNL